MPSPSWTNLDPRLQQAYLAMAARAPGRITISSGWRSNETQTRLHAKKPKLAAEPGKSNHEFGLAIDLTFENAATRKWAHDHAAEFGLWFPMDYEPWHAQLIGIDRHNIRGGAQIGGGRDAFSLVPDRRFLNPYDVLSSVMDQEDNSDPLTQFGRLVSAVSSPIQMALGQPTEVAAMATPGTTGMESGIEVNPTSPTDIPLEPTGGSQR